MAKERSRYEEREAENQLHAHEARDADNQRPAESTVYRQPGRFALTDPNALGDQPLDWSEQPTQPQRRIEARHDWPPRSSSPHPEWPLRDATASAAASPLHRLIDAAHERQFTLGCGTVAALVLIVAALLAAITNGWLLSSAGPIERQPNIQANPAQSTTPMPTITPLPSPTVTPVPTDTPFPTVTPFPTETPVPTATPLPTETPAPTQEPTVTPTPPQPSATPVPTATVTK